jgi:hypothetical protein
MLGAVCGHARIRQPGGEFIGAVAVHQHDCGMVVIVGLCQPVVCGNVADTITPLPTCVGVVVVELLISESLEFGRKRL